MSKKTWFKCPVCLMGYSQSLRSDGSKCGDTSSGQTEPCVGRLIPQDEFERADWLCSVYFKHKDPRHIRYAT